MLVTSDALGERRRLVAGALAPLADSLAYDLGRLVATDDIHVPTDKARLTRAGGRCPRCGRVLEFDPWSPRRHRCAACDAHVTGVEHDAMWIMWYQLWLAERATHAAALYATRGDARHRALTERILRRYVERYLAYPNRDNVLGPTRVFFSTYLEAMWLLQLVCALDLLETVSSTAQLGSEVRERLIQPSATLVAEYDEGLSNRQVWNNAALMASGVLLGDSGMAERAVHGPSGLLEHLGRALLADATWYEGENYHLFAHRGLWYGVTIAERAGFEIPDALRQRYRRAFELPFLTALPDFTFPSRRDSQYRVSLRQWRVAESCELGIADCESAVLATALGELYRDDVPRGDTGRAQSTGEAERNAPASRLTRADLGWKSLLFAAAEPLAEDASRGNPASVLLPEQGFAVLRRDAGRTYAALDYGITGGGHGHPDRLNLWLIIDDGRFLEDVGTGSYVDPSLHWYRSTLAHNAPLADGHSQQRNDGELIAYAERGDFGWTLARAMLAPNVEAERAMIVAPDYVIDELTWVAAADTVVDLPIHVAGTAAGVARWTPARLRGGDGLEDGFAFLESSAHSDPITSVTLAATAGGRHLALRVLADAPFVLWRTRGPGPPNEAPRDFFVVRAVGPRGRIRSVLDGNDAISDAEAAGDHLVIRRRDGAQHTHVRRENEWQISTGKEVVALGGAVRPRVTEGALVRERVARGHHRVPTVERVADVPGSLAADRGPALRFELAREDYRRSEPTWDEAGRPRAVVAFAATRGDLHVDIVVKKSPISFAPARTDNPLDNEHPDINSDGVQLYVGPWSWLLVPEQPEPNVRSTPRQGTPAATPGRASWMRTAEGYALRIVVARGGLPAGPKAFTADVIVNEITPDRERRRGQLVLSGGRDEWVYLRGDRHDASRYLQFVIEDA